MVEEVLRERLKDQSGLGHLTRDVEGNLVKGQP